MMSEWGEYRISDRFDDLRVDLREIVDKLERRVEECAQTIHRIWEALGINTYEEAHGETIWELVSDLKQRAGDKGETMKFLTEKELNTIRGKASVGKATSKEILSVFEHLDSLEMQLNEADDQDLLGTEGWRHWVGYPE